jgi:hypothetical protein
MLGWTEFNDVSSYRIVVMWRTHPGRERKIEAGRLEIQPRRGLEISKGFPFSNIFTKMKIIWIQFKFEF